MPKFFRRARARAFQALFEAEFGRLSGAEVLAREQEPRPMPDEEREFSARIVAGVGEHREQLDALIGETATQWPVAELAPVDRTLLRIALFELLFNNAAVPGAAVINEAVEIAKRYGSDASRRFVNGVLGTVSRERVPQPSASTTETEEAGGPI